MSFHLQSTDQLLLISLFTIGYVITMANSLWQRGALKSRVSRWRRGLILCIILQGGIVLAIQPKILRDISSSPTGILNAVSPLSYKVKEERVSKSTDVLPGGVVVEEYNGLRINKVSTKPKIIAVRLGESSSSSINSTEQPTTNSTTEVALDGRALNYPNPFSFARDGGTTLGYRLTAPGEIVLEVYDMFANKIFDKQFPKNQNGGWTLDYNRVELSSLDFGSSNVPAGIYYYTLSHEGRLLGKGKMAVIP
jgi:hypothetical protein